MVVLTISSPPREGIRHQQPKTKAYVKEQCYGDGTVYIAEEYVSWISESGEGFTLDYPVISLHAVSRDLSAFSSECLYLLLEQNSSSQDMHDSDGSDSSVHSSVTEVRFVPEDKGMLDAMFSAMSECQVLHPGEGDDDVDDEYYGGEGDNEDIHLTSQGQRTLEHLENIFNSSGDPAAENTGGYAEMDTTEVDGEGDQFEDAD